MLDIRTILSVIRRRTRRGSDAGSRFPSLANAPETLHDFGALRVTCTIGDPARADTAVDLVTFDPWRARNQAQPFSRTFALKYGLNVLHVLPVGDDWYQYEVLEACLAAVAPHVGPRTLGYGSSMGGYAATSYADLAGLRTVLALSPQFTITRDVVPFETRWTEDARRISFRPDHARVAPGVRHILLFDPINRDARHAELIEAAAPGRVVSLRVPGGGHPVGTTLAEAGLLSGLLRAVLRDGALPAGFEAEMLAALPRSPSYHRILAVQTRGEAGAAHLQAGLALAPEDRRLRFAWALHLKDVGRLDEALAEARWVLQRRPHHPAYQRLIAQIESKRRDTGD